MDWLRDWWPVILAAVGGLIGFGKISQKHTTTQEKVAEIKKEVEIIKDSAPMTLVHCKERQESCHTIQSVYHGGLEKDVEELRLGMQKEMDDIRGAVKHMKHCNDTQHGKIIERGDTQHRDIINHILDINNNGKTK